MNTTLVVQRALIARGYDIGPAGADGILGRATIAAVAKFQKDACVDVRYPGTIGPKTLTALGVADSASVSDAPTWIGEARRFIGKHEVRDARELDRELGLDASETAWCGAFVAMVIAAVLPQERLPANPLGARQWLKLGVALDDAKIGAVAVFWRGAKDGWSGHVGFVVGHDETHLHILGGNQSDAVTVARISKARLLGLRWPSTAPAAAPTRLAFSTIAAAITTNEA